MVVVEEEEKEEGRRRIGGVRDEHLEVEEKEQKQRNQCSSNFRSVIAATK